MSCTIMFIFLQLDSLHFNLHADYCSLQTALQHLKQEVQQKWNSDHAEKRLQNTAAILYVL